MSIESNQDNCNQSDSNPFSSFKEGLMLQLADIFKLLGRISVVAIPVLILLFLGKGGSNCVISSNMPIVAGSIASVGLVLLLGNPLIGIFAGIVVGLILKIPLIQHFLCM